VHTASFPYFSLLAAALARPRGRYTLVCDWHEVWSREYWREYLGAAGWIGAAVQRRCARVRQRAFCFSRLHAQRLRDEGLRGEVVVLEGEYAGPLEPDPPLPAEPLVLFAGRLIPEKRAPSLVPAIELAAASVPGLRGVIFGDGPDRDAVAAAIAALAEPWRVTAPGFVNGSELHAALRRAAVMVLPSSREGYGMIVVEAAACGTPSVVVRAPDNAAVELIEEGVNGFVAGSVASTELAAAIVAVCEAGEALRSATREWFAANATRLSLEGSLATVLASYERSPNTRA
jgi:glycosyltransferase involved in cell wall biosynthesis